MPMRSLPGLSAAILMLSSCMGGSGATEKPVADVRFEQGPQLGAPRATHQLIAPGDGTLLAIGGCVAAGCEAGPASATIDIIDAASMTLVGQGKLRERRIQPSAVALRDGRVLILGGWVGGRVSATSEIFAPATGNSSVGPRWPGREMGPPSCASLMAGS